MYFHYWYRYRDIARELGASVSGVQKVWERFLSTGTIGDKKPSPTIGRPRKFGKSGDLVGVAYLCVCYYWLS